MAAIAAQVTSGATTGFDRAVALTRWFTGPDSAFRYDVSTAPGNGDDAMVDFLTRGRRGYCEQFASSMAAMLRTVGVPSRVAVGFTGGREAGDSRSVSTADAHAWVEAWFPGAGWTTFDPTPLADGRAIVPPYVIEATGDAQGSPDAAAAQPPDRPDAATAAPEPTASADRGTVAGTPNAAAAPSPSTLVASLLRVLLALAAAGVVAALVAAPSLLRARQRRRRLAVADAGGPGAAGAAWDELLAESADRGSPTPATDTVRGAARRIVDDHGLDERAQRALRSVVGIVEESWYGDVDAAPGALTGPVREVHEAIATTPRDCVGGCCRARSSTACAAGARAHGDSGGVADRTATRRRRPRSRDRRQHRRRRGSPALSRNRRGVEIEDQWAGPTSVSRSASLLLEPAAEPLLHTAGETALVLLAPFGRVLLPLGADGRDRHDGTGEHHQEPDHAEHREVVHDPQRPDRDTHDEQHEAEYEDSDALEATAAGRSAQPSAADGDTNLGSSA